MQPEISQIYQGVMEFISQATTLAEDAPLANMDELNQKVEKLTTAINALPIEKRLTYSGEINALFEALKDLENKLIQKQGQIKTDLSAAPKHKAANSAYNKISRIDKKE